jgi:CubicO group peptidase (beta-lactamase class C family)
VRRLAAFLACACSSPAAAPDGAQAIPDGPRAAPDAGIADLASTLEPFRAAAGAPAMAAAVFHGGTLLAVGATGVRKLGAATSATSADLWHLGSDTKAMTATLIGIYVDGGTLHFSDTIATLFAGETIDPGYQGVTLDELLQHRGGLPGDIPPDIWAQMWADGASPDARIKAVRALLARPPAQAPGTFVYANAGYIVAGAALERATGDTWEHLISTRLWAPLGMTSCGFGAPGSAGQVDQPWGHVTNADGSLTPMDPGAAGSDNPPSLGPAGTAHCSLADWGKFLALHVAGARGEATTLIKTATLTHLQTPPAGGDYACGWIVTSRPWAGGTALTHTGSNTLWYATAWLAPAKDLAFVVASNCASPAAAKQVDLAFGPLIQTYAP